MQDGAAPLPPAGLQSVQTLGLVARKPGVDDDLAAADLVGDLSGGEPLGLEEDHPAALAEGLGGAMVGGLHERGALFFAEFDCLNLCHGVIAA